MAPAGGGTHAGVMNDTMNNPGTSDQAQYQPRPSHPLSRPRNGRMLAGVAAGLADYLGVDPTLVRIAFVLLAFLGGAAVPVYLACWLIIPEEGSDQSIAGDWFASRQR
jgi:phage shock protein C